MTQWCEPRYTQFQSSGEDKLKIKNDKCSKAKAHDAMRASNRGLNTNISLKLIQLLKTYSQVAFSFLFLKRIFAITKLNLALFSMSIMKMIMCIFQPLHVFFLLLDHFYSSLPFLLNSPLSSKLDVGCKSLS